MKIALILFLLVVIAAVTALFIFGRISASGEAPGLIDGQLARCPQTPNCVCSEFKDDISHYIEPLSMVTTQEFSTIITAIGNIGGEVVSQSNNYLAARFSSQLFGFVDDVEIRLDPEQGIIQFRSASRIGHSDFGVNRKRIEQLKEQLTHHR